MRRDKRGQMEIMGLAIIVILVSLAMLFAVQWMLNPSTATVQKTKQSVLAASLLTTMVGTTTDCNKRTVGELLGDCALTQGATKCADMTSCDYVRGVMGSIFNATMKKWKLNYYFHITGASSVEDMKFGSGSTPQPCKGAKQGKEYPLVVTQTYELKLYLDICG